MSNDIKNMECKVLAALHVPRVGMLFRPTCNFKDFIFYLFIFRLTCKRSTAEPQFHIIISQILFTTLKIHKQLFTLINSMAVGPTRFNANSRGFYNNSYLEAVQPISLHWDQFPMKHSPAIYSSDLLEASFLKFTC